ncbi:D-alanyl-D-alanine carboxypeptidase [Candidatus Poriferisocius sp.]|uniref:D-alanyl-D-alanine carboxypeptidase n=1 Tax=Candidatus Poriferisocius sp. TaxID=3101276 RepID=UPI003B019932
MRRIVMPLLLLAVALGSLVGSNYLSDRLHENLGEVVADDTAPPGVGTPLISTLRLRELLTPSLTEPDFFTTLDNLMATAPAAACLSVNLDDRVPPFYESGANTQVMPSEGLVLLTLATANEVLGPDHRFTTSVQSTVPMDGGVVNGDIYLVGGGDPLLFTEEFLATPAQGQDRLHTPVEDLAQVLVDDGLSLVTGAVVGDATRYDDLRYVPSWPENIIDSEKIGTQLALQFDDGWVQFPVSEPQPAADEADGTGEQDGANAYLSAEDPPFYAAALFDDMLEARDVVIRRSPRSEAVPEDEEAYLLASIESAPLSDHYRQILANRDIETTELLLKEIGLAASGTGSTIAGFQAVENTLNDAGIEVDQLQLLQFDGSGIDPANVATCPVFTSLLDSAEFSPLFHELLPTAAEAGPLRDRFGGVTDPGRITAFSGGASNVTAMMGYIDIGRGQEMTFAFIANQPGADDNRAIGGLEEQIVRHLATLAAKPSLDDIGLQPIRSG